MEKLKNQQRILDARSARASCSIFELAQLGTVTQRPRLSQLSALGHEPAHVANQGLDPTYCRKRKAEIRQHIWGLLENRNIARFPRPVHGRIPNFDGAGAAAARLCKHRLFGAAKVVKINPDAPQRPIRELTLREGKILVAPTPKLRGGFLLLDPKQALNPSRASTIRGAATVGRRIEFDEMPRIDLIVAGSVAVTIEGARLGKGGGYSEIEYAILREAHVVDEATPIVTTVHDTQIVGCVPLEEHDLTVNVIATPSKTIECRSEHPRPTGIIWDRIDPLMLKQIPQLRKLGKAQGQ